MLRTVRKAEVLAQVIECGWGRQANLVKQLAKLVKVRYVEDITHSERVGAASDIYSSPEMSQR